MLDTTMNESAPRAWQNKLRPGSIVLFRFPHAEPDAPPQTPKSRTCLVLEVEHRNERIFAELVCGTSVATAPLPRPAALPPTDTGKGQSMMTGDAPSRMCSSSRCSTVEPSSAARRDRDELCRLLRGIETVDPIEPGSPSQEAARIAALVR